MLGWIAKSRPSAAGFGNTALAFTAIVRPNIGESAGACFWLIHVTPALHHTCPGGRCQGTQCGASVANRRICILAVKQSLF